MSSRRSARARGVVPRQASRVPAALLDVTDPVWHDEEALTAAFPDLVDDAVRRRLHMGGRVQNMITGRWCLAHGYVSHEDTRRPDWAAFRRLVDEWGTK